MMRAMVVAFEDSIPSFDFSLDMAIDEPYVIFKIQFLFNALVFSVF